MQLVANRSAKQDREQEATAKARAHARSLLFKVIKIESDFLQFKREFDDAHQRAERTRIPFGWGVLRPLASLPRDVAFTNEEMMALSRCQNDDLFNEVLALDEVHSSVVQILELYRVKRMDLSEQMPAEISGSIGTTELNSEERRKLSPRMAQLDGLVHDMATLIENETRRPLDLSKRLATSFNSEYGGRLTIEAKDEKPSDRSAEVSS